MSAEHASPELPPGCDLGLSAGDLRSHASWDPGAADIARRLADWLGVFAYLGSYSRLWVDLNRSADAPEAVPVTSFGLTVPGNQGLSEDARAERIRRHHTPYRRAVSRAVRRVLHRDAFCLHLAIHSFVPDAGDGLRELDVGILFDPDRAVEAALAQQLIEGLARRGLDTRPNEPYAGIADGLTTALRREFGPAEYAGIEVEWSQRRVAAASGARRASDALRTVVETLSPAAPR